MAIQLYDAFISYRHAPLDIRAARKIQSQLEHFRIPDHIQKKTGIERIYRVFRDQEDLPVTSDLSNNIRYALDHSKILIVICSLSTNDSIWVRREIEYFLKTHTRDQIYTVLIEGEPSQVIPDIITREETELPDTDRSVTDAEVKTFEPLSADYRMNGRRARRRELPRLVAGMIHCDYRELVRRDSLSRSMASFVAAIVLFALIGLTIVTFSTVRMYRNLLGNLQKSITATPSKTAREESSVTSQGKKESQEIILPEEAQINDLSGEELVEQESASTQTADSKEQNSIESSTSRVESIDAHVLKAEPQTNAGNATAASKQKSVKSTVDKNKVTPIVEEAQELRKSNAKENSGTESIREKNEKAIAQYDELLKYYEGISVEYFLSSAYLDLDGDGVKEGFFYYKPLNQAGSGWNFDIYTVEKGKVKSLVKDGGYGFEWIETYPETKTLVIYSCGHGGEGYGYYKIRNKKLKMIASKGRSTMPMNVSWHYYSNGEQVSKAEFDKITKDLLKGKSQQKEFF